MPKLSDLFAIESPAPPQPKKKQSRLPSPPVLTIDPGDFEVTTSEKQDSERLQQVTEAWKAAKSKLLRASSRMRDSGFLDASNRKDVASAVAETRALIDKTMELRLHDHEAERAMKDWRAAIRTTLNRYEKPLKQAEEHARLVDRVWRREEQMKMNRAAGLPPYYGFTPDMYRDADVPYLNDHQRKEIGIDLGDNAGVGRWKESAAGKQLEHFGAMLDNGGPGDFDWAEALEGKGGDDGESE